MTTEPTSTLSSEHSRRLLAELDPKLKLLGVRPMGAEGTHPAFVIEASSAGGVRLQLAVKCYRNDVGTASERARLEYKTLVMMQAHAVPVPKPLYLDEQGSLFGMPAVVTTFVKGQQVLAPDDALAYARELAQVLVKIHSISITPAEMEWLENANRQVLWFRKSGVMPDYLVNHPDGQKVWNAIEALLPAQQPVSPTFVHTDYWIGQVLWEQARITAVLDWEEAGYGDPAYDLAYCRLDLCLGAAGRTAADELLKVYEAEMGHSLTNLRLWEWVAVPRVIHNTAWEVVCRQQLREFIADRQTPTQKFSDQHEMESI